MYIVYLLEMVLRKKGIFVGLFVVILSLFVGKQSAVFANNFDDEDYLQLDKKMQELRQRKQKQDAKTQTTEKKNFVLLDDSLINDNEKNELTQKVNSASKRGNNSGISRAATSQDIEAKRRKYEEEIEKQELKRQEAELQKLRIANELKNNQETSSIFEDKKIHEEKKAKAKTEEEKRAQILAEKRREEERLKAEKEAQKKAESEKKKANEEKKKLEEEKRKAEEARKKAELLAKQEAEKKAIEAKNRADMKAKQQVEAKKKAEAEAKKRVELNAKKKTEEEQKKIAEAKRQEQIKKLNEIKRLAAIKRQEDAKKQEQARIAEEKKYAEYNAKLQAMEKKLEEEKRKKEKERENTKLLKNKVEQQDKQLQDAILSNSELKAELAKQQEERKNIEAKIQQLKSEREQKIQKLIKINKNNVVKSTNVTKDADNTMGLISKIENNLTYSTKKKEESKDTVDIKKGSWSNEDLVEKEKINFAVKKTSKKIDDMTAVLKNEDQKAKNMKDLAEEAMKGKNYEIAVKYYKQALKVKKDDNFAKLALATTYHLLGQYRQAKPLYVELLDVYPNSEQIVSNLLSIIIQESPYEAIYIFPTFANKYTNSALIQAQTSVAFANLERNKEAKMYLYRAMALDPNNVEYKYNMAILLDKTNSKGEAQNLYNEVLRLDPNNTVRNSKIKARLSKMK